MKCKRYCVLIFFVHFFADTVCQFDNDEGTPCNSALNEVQCGYPMAQTCTLTCKDFASNKVCEEYEKCDNEDCVCQQDQYRTLKEKICVDKDSCPPPIVCKESNMELCGEQGAGTCNIPCDNYNSTCDDLELRKCEENFDCVCKENHFSFINSTTNKTQCVTVEECPPICARTNEVLCGRAESRKCNVTCEDRENACENVDETCTLDAECVCRVGFFQTFNATTNLTDCVSEEECPAPPPSCNETVHETRCGSPDAELCAINCKEKDKTCEGLQRTCRRAFDCVCQKGFFQMNNTDTNQTVCVPKSHCPEMLNCEGLHQLPRICSISLNTELCVINCTDRNKTCSDVERYCTDMCVCEKGFFGGMTGASSKNRFGCIAPEECPRDPKDKGYSTPGNPYIPSPKPSTTPGGWFDMFVPGPVAGIFKTNKTYCKYPNQTFYANCSEIREAKLMTPTCDSYMTRGINKTYKFYNDIEKCKKGLCLCDDKTQMVKGQTNCVEPDMCLPQSNETCKYSGILSRTVIYEDQEIFDCTKTPKKRKCMYDCQDYNTIEIMNDKEYCWSKDKCEYKCVCSGKGMVMNTSNQCMPKSECQINCGENEESLNCLKDYQCNVNCKELHDREYDEYYVKCTLNKTLGHECEKRCYCAKWYYRNALNKCVRKKECVAEFAANCSVDEDFIYKKQWTQDNCNQSCSEYKRMIPCNDTWHYQTGCHCPPGYVRDDTSSKCITKQQCYKNDDGICSRTNHESYICPSEGVCDQSCLDAAEDNKCRVSNKNPCEESRKKCVCDPGYYWEKKKCVLKNDCRAVRERMCPGENRLFVKKTLTSNTWRQCEHTCETKENPATQQYCDKIELKEKHRDEKCMCKVDYVKANDSTNICVPQYECPQAKNYTDTNCTDNQVYMYCLTDEICDLTCKEYNNAQGCKHRCVNKCVCSLDYYRKSETDSKCIPKGSCPSDKPPPCPDPDDTNTEVRKECAKGKNTKLCNIDCDDKDKKTCSSFSGCEDECVCIANHFRLFDILQQRNACVPRSECPKTQCKEDQILINCKETEYVPCIDETCEELLMMKKCVEPMEPCVHSRCVCNVTTNVLVGEKCISRTECKKQKRDERWRCDYAFLGNIGWFKYHDIPANYGDANRYCQMEGAMLLAPTTKLFKSIMTKYIRLRDNYTFKKGLLTGYWRHHYGTVFYPVNVNGEDADPLDYSSNFLPWAPTHHDLNVWNYEQTCIHLHNNGTISAEDCSFNAPFICFRRRLPKERLEYKKDCGVFVVPGATDSLPGKKQYYKAGRENRTYVFPEWAKGKKKKKAANCYIFHWERLAWPDADTVCRSEGAYLTIIDTEEEYREIYDRTWRHTKFHRNPVALTSHVWIGLTSYHMGVLGHWMSLDGSDWYDAKNKSDYWNYKEPDKFPGLVDSEPDHCAVMKWSGYYEDWPCEIEINFICEKDPLELIYCYGDNPDAD